MGWELRKGKRFYYRKERYTDEAGRSRVRSIYCGSGEHAEAVAREDEERRRGVFPTHIKSAPGSEIQPPAREELTHLRAEEPAEVSVNKEGPLTADEILRRGAEADDSLLGQYLLRKLLSGGDLKGALARARIPAAEAERRGLRLNETEQN